MDKFMQTHESLKDQPLFSNLKAGSSRNAEKVARFKSAKKTVTGATLTLTYSVVNPEAELALRKTEAQLLEAGDGFRRAADMTSDQVMMPNAGEQFRELASRLTKKHPQISVQMDLFRGAPHVKGTKLTVANALAYVTMLGSTEAASRELGVSKEQVEEALTYARSFVRIATDPYRSTRVRPSKQEL